MQKRVTSRANYNSPLDRFPNPAGHNSRCHLNCHHLIASYKFLIKNGQKIFEITSQHAETSDITSYLQLASNISSPIIVSSLLGALTNESLRRRPRFFFPQHPTRPTKRNQPRCACGLDSRMNGTMVSSNRFFNPTTRDIRSTQIHRELSASHWDCPVRSVRVVHCQ